LSQPSAYRSVFKNAAYIFFIKLFPTIAALGVLILFSRELPEADYGNYQGFWVKLLLMGTVAYAGLPVTIITYSPAYIKRLYKTFKGKALNGIILWLLLWAIIFSILEFQSLQLSFFLSFGLLVLYSINAIQESLLISAQRMKGLFWVNILYSSYFFAVHYQSLGAYDLQDLLWFVLSGMMIRAIVLAVILFTLFNNLPTAALSIDIKMIRGLWLHLGFYDLLQNIFRWLDKFILSMLLSSQLYAIYFNGAQEIPLLPYLFGAVSSAILVQLGNVLGKESDQPHKLSFTAGKILSCIVFPLFFFLFFHASELFSIVLSDKYLPAVPIFMMSLLVLPLRAYNYTTILQHLHKGAIINKGAILDLLIALALMYPLYLVFGLPGIVLSFVISTYIQVAYYLFYLTKFLQISLNQLLPFKNWVIKFFVFGIIQYFSQMIFSNQVYSLLSGLTVLIILILGGVSFEYSANRFRRR
jgi:O-antigen/teichoic acid export membrane protein